MEVVEDKLSKNIKMNMADDKFFRTFGIFLDNHRTFLRKVCHKHKDESEKFISKLGELERRVGEMHKIYIEEI